MLYEQLIAEYPGHAAAHHNYGMVLRKLGRADDALRQAETAHQLAPDHPTIVFSLGLCQENIGNTDKAETHYRQALALRPEYPAALNNLGRLLDLRDRPNDAVELLEAARAHAPEDEDIALNLANTLLSLGRPDESLVVLQKLSESAPSLNATGIAYYVQRDWATSSLYFQKALKADPAFAGAHENLALSLLHEDKFAEGWEEYEWRWQNAGNHLTDRQIDASAWEGEVLGDKHLLLHAEQGFGDTIQFIRFGALIPKEDGQITLAVQEQLVSLLSHVPWADRVISLDGPVPAADYHMSLASLPRLLDPSGVSVKTMDAYLQASEGQTEESISSNDPIRIGVCWAGRDRHLYDPSRNRSCPASLFEELAHLPSIKLTSLQTGPHAAERPDFIAPNSRPLDDFQHSAEEILDIDFVITVDTAIAHLCGALGKPGLVLLNFAADWRWGEGNGPAPWYPSLVLIRQDAPGDWEGVFGRMVAQFRDKLS